MYQFARVPPKFSDIILQKKKTLDQPKTSLEDQKRTFPQFEWDFVPKSPQYGVNGFPLQL